ncbi:glucokinase [soil metagenome]
MNVLAIDLGGTKLSLAVLSPEGAIIEKGYAAIKYRKDKEVGALITAEIKKIIALQEENRQKISSIGVAVPGIYRSKTGTVWAPNISGWTDYPLLNELEEANPGIPVNIDSDRACYILGESWLGNAKGCKDAIYLSVGTGIGAGILINGNILRGTQDIAGSIGWMALQRPFEKKYIGCGCFEYYASGSGITKVALELMQKNNNYSGVLNKKQNQEITAQDVFSANDQQDPIAKEVVQGAIQFWGMAIANLVGLFNPEKIILGGGVFGPAIIFIPEINEEAAKWAQPISMTQVSLEPSKLGNDAGLYGAGLLALENLK